MKAIKNSECVLVKLKYELDKLRTLEHPSLPAISYITTNENYSYIVYEKLPFFSFCALSSSLSGIHTKQCTCRCLAPFPSTREAKAKANETPTHTDAQAK